MAPKRVQVTVKPGLHEMMKAAVNRVLNDPDVKEHIQDRPSKERSNFKNILRETVEMGYLEGLRDAGEAMSTLTTQFKA